MDFTKFEKAYWLVHNTKLNFAQVADYCEISELEVKAIADGVSRMCSSGYDLIRSGDLSEEELLACEENQDLRLKRTVIKKTRRKSTR